MKLMKPKIIPIAITSLALGLLFDYLFVGKMPGVSVPLYALLILGSTFYLARIFNTSLQRAIYTIAPVILFFAVMILIRASEMLLVFNIILMIYLFLLLFKLITRSGKTLKQYRLSDYFERLPWLPFDFLSQTMSRLRSLLDSHRDASRRTVYAPYILGVAISLPILVIFMALLASADLVLQNFLSSIFEFRLNPEFTFRSLLVLFIASLFLGAFAILFMQPPQAEKDTEKKTAHFTLGPIETSIVLGSIAALFFIFLLIQVRYFFGGAEQVVSTGFTYAEYARRGFFELIAVAIITMLVIWSVKKASQGPDDVQTKQFKWLSGVLIIEVLIIMLSAHMRLSLYEEAYGFTVLRLFSHILVGWLAAAFILLILHIMREEQERQFAFRLFISVLTFFAVLNLINPDAFIARQNIARFDRTGKLDVSYLNRLSPDATPTVVQLLDSKDKRVKADITTLLFIKKERLNCTDNSWQSFNLSRQHAENILLDKSAVLAPGAGEYRCPSPTN